MNYEEQEWFHLLYEFLCDRYVLEAYVLCLEHQDVYHGPYDKKCVRDMINIFSWNDAKKLTGIQFGILSGEWRKHCGEDRTSISLEREKLQHALLNYNKKISTIDVYRSLKNENMENSIQ